MKITYQYISDVFQHSLSQSSTEFDRHNKIAELLFYCMEINKELWKLEDVSRMHDLGFESIAKAKMAIDIANQKRNETISNLDIMFDRHLCNTELKSLTKFYSESPGMLIDRMAILTIRQNFIKKLIEVIDDKQLKDEYLMNENYINQNIKELGEFIDRYFDNIIKGEMFFKIYKPVKIYNDQRVNQYIKALAAKRS